MERDKAREMGPRKRPPLSRNNARLTPHLRRGIKRRGGSASKQPWVASIVDCTGAPHEVAGEVGNPASVEGQVVGFDLVMQRGFGRRRKAARALRPMGYVWRLLGGGNGEDISSVERDAQWRHRQTYLSGIVQRGRLRSHCANRCSITSAALSPYLDMFSPNTRACACECRRPKGLLATARVPWTGIPRYLSPTVDTHAGRRVNRDTPISCSW